MPSFLSVIQLKIIPEVRMKGVYRKWGPTPEMRSANDPEVWAEGVVRDRRFQTGSGNSSIFEAVFFKFNKKNFNEVF